MPRENLYFIAIIPQNQVSDEITAFRLEFAKRFQSKAALKNMPHITLKTPFKFPAADQQALTDWFDGLSFSIPKFEIELDNFGSFQNKNKPVVYVHPKETPLLLALQQQLIQQLRAAYPRIDF